MINKLLFVFLGGGLGSAFRYLLGFAYNKSNFLAPYGTFLVNILGSLLIGVIAGYHLRTTQLSQSNQLLLIAGFLGGFTTFSSFAFENLVMLQNEKYALFFAYFFSTLLVSMLAVGLGYYLSKHI